jgi:hypothetical protein
MKNANPLIAVLLAFAACSAGAIEVEVGPTALRGVTIVSADIARDLDSTAQVLVIRLHNGAEEAGQKVTLAVTVHDKNGNAKGMRAQQIEVEAAPDGEQVFSQSIPSFADTDDTLTVELLDWANSSRGVDESTAYEEQRGPLRRIEECELDETTESRLNELNEQLDNQRQRYSENHPTVVRVRRLIDELTRERLADCVEQLQ